MSLYNMMNGVKPATFLVLPMLGFHPDEYPRFRDCFLSDPDGRPEYDDQKVIMVYTRTGGGNREDYETENDWIQSIEGFIEDYDDDFDSTFAVWVFNVPEKWMADYDRIVASDFGSVSDEYQAEMIRVFPKLEEQFKQMFSGVVNESESETSSTESA